MKIVIAPDSYKESLSAQEAASAIAAGFREIFPQADYVLVPMADGGEGTVEAVIAATGGRRVPVQVQGPLGEPVEAFYGLSGDGVTAILEMAAASGLALVPPANRNPLHTSSVGTGQLIRSALDAGARKFIIGIGGSATNDGGAGMLQSLGARLLTSRGESIVPTGEGLRDLASIDLSELDARLGEATIDVACDVDNPLCGPQGASAVFGPQKGATPEMVVFLDANLRHFAAITQQTLGVDMMTISGAGAAGGMGGAIYAFLHGRLRHGVDIVTEAVGLDGLLHNADLVVTGEGRIDGQTAHGKTPIGVARVAKRRGIPVMAIGGCLTRDFTSVFANGIDAVTDAVYRPCTVAEALHEGYDNLRMAARNAAALVALGQRI